MTGKPAKMKRGTYVSRAVFTKMQMERDRLLKDIRTMVMSKSIAEVVLLKDKWRNEFEKGKWLTDALKEKAKEMLPAKLDSNPGAFINPPYPKPFKKPTQ